MQTVVIINQKGGCGKTTTAINLAGVAAASGKRTLLIDLDPQSHCAAGLAIPEQRIDLDIGDALLAETLPDKQRLLWRAARNLDLIPSRLKLAGLEAARGGLASKADKEHRLSRVLDSLRGEYDLCVVDCSPSIGLLTYNALVAATSILIPVETSYFSLQGATKQVNTIKALEARLGVSAPYAILPTIHEPDSALATDLINELHRRFEIRVCPTAIRRDRALKESASFGQPVVEYAPNSDGASDYTLASEWIFADEATRAKHTRPESPVPIEPIRSQAPGRNGTDQKVRTTPAAGTAATTLARKLAEPKPIDTSPTTSPSTAHPTQPDIKPDIQRVTQESATSVLTKPARTAVRLIEADGEEIAASSPAAGRIAIAAPAKPGSRPQTPSLGVKASGGRARFALPASIGGSVHLAGDFNHWSESTLPFARRDDLGVFELEMPLIPGKYRYRVIVDGEWQTDPTNPQREPNEFGGFNSILVVPDSKG